MPPELRNRLVFGPLLAAGFFAGIAVDLICGDHYGLFGIVLLSIVLAAIELRRLSVHIGIRISILPMLICSTGLLLAHHLSYAAPSWLGGDARELPLTTLIVAAGFIWMAGVHMHRYGFEDFTRSVGLGMLCLAYIGVCPASFMPLAALPDLHDVLVPDGPLAGLRHDTRGTQLVILHIAVCKIGDICAFFGGRTFGRTRLAPRISPGKTREGFYAAVIGCVGTSYAFSHGLAALGLAPVFGAWWQPLVWGLVLGPLGVIGDLAESCLKRDIGVKDSGSIIPGFGGFLDVFDAVILSAPAAYLLGLLLH